MSFIFKIVFAATVAITLWFSGEAVRDLWLFGRLNHAAAAEIYKWSVQEISSSEFALKASYRFAANGGQWTGKTIFGKPYYLNRPSAEKALQGKRQERFTAWYSLSNPKHNALEKRFPYKKCFHSLVSLGVLFYFLFLQRYLCICAEPFKSRMKKE